MHTCVRASLLLVFFVWFPKLRSLEWIVSWIVFSAVCFITIHDRLMTDEKWVVLLQYVFFYISQEHCFFSRFISIMSIRIANLPADRISESIWPASGILTFLQVIAFSMTFVRLQTQFHLFEVRSPKASFSICRIDSSLGCSVSAVPHSRLEWVTKLKIHVWTNVHTSV